MSGVDCTSKVTVGAGMTGGPPPGVAAGFLASNVREGTAVGTRCCPGRSVLGGSQKPPLRFGIHEVQSE